MIPIDTNRSLSDTAAFHRLSGFRVESLMIQNTGTFNPQFLRPYVTNPHLNNNDLTALSTSIVERAVQGGIDGATVAGIGNSFLTRSSEIDGHAIIPNGWDTQRSQFIMKIVLTNNIGISNPCFVTGYTDHAGINPVTGAIDPKMIFMVNSITQARAVQFRTPMGVTENITSLGTQQLLVDVSNSLMNNGYNSQSQFVMRPDDIFKTMGNSAMYQQADNPLDMHSIHDTSIKLDARSKGGAKRINNGSNYIADILNSYINAPRDESKAATTSALEMYLNTNQFEKYDVYKNDFFKVINSRRQGYATYGNSFSFSELTAIDPNVMNVMTFITTKPGELHTAGQTQHWGGSDLSTVVSSILASSVPSLMTEQLISMIQFKSTNNTVNGQPRTDIIYGAGFDSTVDMSQHYENFKHLFEIMILNDVTFGNQIPYMLEMKVSLSGESWIRIKLDNNPMIDYVTPTFCDSLFSPVITSRLDNMFNMSNDMESLIDYVLQAKGQQTPMPAQQHGVISTASF